MCDINKLHLYTDDIGIPYDDDKNPFPRTSKDDKIEMEFIKEFGLDVSENNDPTALTQIGNDTDVDASR